MRAHAHTWGSVGDTIRQRTAESSTQRTQTMVSHPTNAAVARDGTTEARQRPVPYTALFQPNRLDLLVHLRALVELSGTAWPLTGPDDRNWLEHSDRLADDDGEPSVVTMGVDIDLDAQGLPPIGFGSGGGLVRGTTAAAAGIHVGATLHRVDASGAAPRRTQAEMKAAGFSIDQLRSLARVGLHYDDSSAIVVVDLSDDEAAHAALHELRCRYSEFHTELDHLSADDRARLRIDGSTVGSVQVVCVSGLKDSFAEVVDRHPAIVAHGCNAAAMEITSALFDPDRGPSTSPAHEQRLRRQRRRQTADQLLERVLGR